MSQIPSSPELQQLLENMGNGRAVDLTWLAPLIDHTLLKIDATTEQVEKLCAEAREFGFKGTCVRPEHIALCAKLLAGSAAVPIAVVGFPNGDVPTNTKLLDVKTALEAGARELDMVIPVSALKARTLVPVLADLRAVVDAAGAVPVKVILETSLLTDDEKVIGAALAAAAGARYVKTSTGFVSGGATASDVQLLRRTVGPNIGVKASGGVKDAASALRMVIAGADRIGTSSGVAIVRGLPASPAGVY